MKTAALVALVVLAVLLTEVVGAALWTPLQMDLCPVPEPLWRKDLSAPPPCFEFWLNRYQTGLAALVALAAAWLAARPAIKQFVEARRQSATSARTFVVELALASETELKEFGSFKENLVRIDSLVKRYCEGNFVNFYREWPDWVTMIINSLLKNQTELGLMAVRYTTEGATSRIREKLVTSTSTLLLAVSNLDHAFYQQTAGLDIEDVEMSNVEIESAPINARRALDDCKSLSEAYQRALKADVEAYWKRARQLEHIAVPDLG